MEKKGASDVYTVNHSKNISLGIFFSVRVNNYVYNILSKIKCTNIHLCEVLTIEVIYSIRYDRRDNNIMYRYIYHLYCV